MKQSKFKKKIVEQIKAEEQEQIHQQHLKKKYDVPEDVVVVEKNTSVKILTRAIAGVVRVVVTIIIFILAIIGLASMLYPDTRECVVKHATEIYKEIIRLLPFAL